MKPNKKLIMILYDIMHDIEYRKKKKKNIMNKLLEATAYSMQLGFGKSLLMRPSAGDFSNMSCFNVSPRLSYPRKAKEVKGKVAPQNPLFVLWHQLFEMSADIWKKRVASI